MTAARRKHDHERLIDLALAKGWIRRDQIGKGGWPELLASGILGLIQVAILGMELAGEQGSPTSPGPREDGLTASKRKRKIHLRRMETGGGGDILTAATLRAWNYFKHLEFLAEGGMGRIYKAQDAGLKRKVALKVLRAEEHGQEQRLLREAQLQARMDHANVCRVYDAGTWEGRAFIAMELVEGKTLKDMARHLDMRQKLALMIQACEGVHAAHKRGLIHRDIKPGNIMVAMEEDGARAIVLDFGLARPILPTGLTTSGAMVGTLHFMSPEQARGDKLDQRADIYSLGATIYDLFTGHPPFSTHKGVEAIPHILAGEPPSLMGAVAVPEDLDTVVMKCLEKAPEARYGTARALADDLQRVLDGAPVLARRMPLYERIRRWVWKNQPPVVVGAVGLVIVIGVGALGARERLVAGRRAALAQQFGQEAERIEAISRYIRLQPPRNLEQDWEQLRQRMDRLKEVVEEAGSAGKAPGAYALGRAFLALGNPDEARLHLERAWSLGFHTPGTSLALGQILAIQYERELARVASSATDPLMRKRRLEEIARQWGDLAALRLREGASASVEPRAYQRARLALLEGRLDQAIDESDDALRDAPWHFESMRVEAQAWLQKAQATPSDAECEGYLQKAFRSLDAARAIARSDRSLVVLQLQCWQEKVGRGWRLAIDPLPYAKAQLALAKELRVLEPSNVTSWVWEGRVCGEEARYLLFANRSPEPWLSEATAAARWAYDHAPNNPEACAALASVLRTQGFLRHVTYSGDPEPFLREGVRVAEQGLALDPGSIFLSNLRLACHVILLDYLKTVGRFDLSKEEALVLSYRKELWAHPNTAYLRANLASILLNIAVIKDAQDLDPTPCLNEVRLLYEQALQLIPGHQGFYRGILCGCALEAQTRLKKGIDPIDTVNGAIYVLERAHRAGLKAAELEVPVAVAELAWVEARQRQGEKPWALLRRARVRLLRAGGYYSEPMYHLRALINCELLTAEMADSPETRRAAIKRASSRLLSLIKLRSADPELKAFLHRLNALG